MIRTTCCYLLIGAASFFALNCGMLAAAEKEHWPFGDPEGAVSLAPNARVWIHPQRKLVIVDGKVCLRRGQLEMFACPLRSKEHESVVAVQAQPRIVHAGLLAVGAAVGHPVQFDPKYLPAAGTPIDIFVLWKDKAGKKHKAPAQQWIRQVKTGKAMRDTWVFAGSGFFTDPETGKRYYHADGGDFICVSNFSSAMLDLPVPSSQAAAELLFEAFTENIPPLETKVRLVLVPRLKKVDKPK